MATSPCAAASTCERMAGASNRCTAAGHAGRHASSATSARCWAGHDMHPYSCHSFLDLVPPTLHCLTPAMHTCDHILTSPDQSDSLGFRSTASAFLQSACSTPCNNSISKAIWPGHGGHKRSKSYWQGLPGPHWKVSTQRRHWPPCSSSKALLISAGRTRQVAGRGEGRGLLC